jgi:hypothetical protein
MKAWLDERRGEFAEAKRPTTPVNFLAPKRQLGGRTWSEGGNRMRIILVVVLIVLLPGALKSERIID